MDDLSETFLHDLGNKHSDFQSVDSTSKNLSSQFKSNSSDEKTSQSCSSSSRISSLKNVVFHYLLSAICFMVLFQVLTDSHVFHSPCIDIAHRIPFSLPQLSRNPAFHTINSHKPVNISSWQHAIYYSQQRFLSQTYSSWLPDILGHSYLKSYIIHSSVFYHRLTALGYPICLDTVILNFFPMF